MYYKIIIIIILILIVLVFIYKNKNKDKEIENFNLTEVLQNMASVYEESDGTLSFKNLKASGDTDLKRLIVNSTFLIRGGLVNNGASGINNTNGMIVNSGSGGIVNTAGNITNRGKLINSDSAQFDKSIEVLGDISGNLVSLKGMIVMWSGTIGSIPEGWKICDGQNGTPDLRSRFVIGASLSGASLDPGLTVKEFKPAGNKGGVETVTLAAWQMPRHSHGLTNFINEGFNCWGQNCRSSGAQRSVESLSGKQRKTGQYGGPADMYYPTDMFGGDGAHENMPPFYALAYIMKI
jgi:microcystin-dependent protein